MFPWQHPQSQSRSCKKWLWSERSDPTLACTGVNQVYGFQWIYLWANPLFSQNHAFVLEDMFATGYWVLYLGEVPLAVLCKLVVNLMTFFFFMIIVFNWSYFSVSLRNLKFCGHKINLMRRILKKKIQIETQRTQNQPERIRKMLAHSHIF